LPPHRGFLPGGMAPLHRGAVRSLWGPARRRLRPAHFPSPQSPLDTRSPTRKTKKKNPSPFKVTVCAGLWNRSRRSSISGAAVVCGCARDDERTRSGTVPSEVPRSRGTVLHRPKGEGSAAPESFETRAPLRLVPSAPRDSRPVPVRWQAMPGGGRGIDVDSEAAGEFGVGADRCPTPGWEAGDRGPSRSASVDGVEVAPCGRATGGGERRLPPWAPPNVLCALDRTWARGNQRGVFGNQPLSTKW